ncbi:ATP-binding protein [Streptomyces sp. NPDC006879]|uniref:ATP-binding protein n=1 Tax=Streptomyces sp. NPDC006879 TaxID=3364767 RepID=UPI0036C5D344
MEQHIEWRFPRTPRSVGRARALLVAQAAEWKIPDETAATAVLLLSELLTNACRHARVPSGRQVWVRCSLRGPGPGRFLWVAVLDANRTLPEPREAGPDDEGGRGLTLVAALAHSWGAGPRVDGVGKTVWFRMRAEAEGADGAGLGGGG